MSEEKPSLVEELPRQVEHVLEEFKKFLRLESAGGIVLFMGAALAMLIANSALKPIYDLLVQMPVEIRVGAFFIGKPLLLWINDGLMAVFFFMVGLELKREILDGELSDIKTVVLPAAGAVGGMLFPALFYLVINRGDPAALQGWAVPVATDIAFALGILALLGKRVPTSLKAFLVSLAIFDDLGAIIIIALFYTSNLSLTALLVALACLVPLLVLNRRGVMAIAPYIFFGTIMWVALLKSGVHATLAGVILALFIPLGHPEQSSRSPLRELEHDLHTLVAFVILPLFAFANAGISFAAFNKDSLLHPVTLGITLGLFLGKQFGVFLCCYLAVKFKLAALPRGVDWPALYGVALLAGVGFTMSLFIGSLAFEQSGVDRFVDERLGIMFGSLLSGVAGYALLRVCLPRDRVH